MEVLNRSVLLWPTPLLAGIAIALLSIVFGNGANGYGFPFAWKTGGCPPPGIVISSSCFVAIGNDWLGFGLDTLLYTIIGYGLLLAYTRYNARTMERRQAA